VTDSSRLELWYALKGQAELLALQLEAMDDETWLDFLDSLPDPTLGTVATTGVRPDHEIIDSATPSSGSGIVEIRPAKHPTGTATAKNTRRLQV
jgi:hypothetical protein